MRRTNFVSYNPALYLGIGLFPLIVVCTDLRSALIYSLLFALTLVLTQLLVGGFRLIIGKRVRFICYTLAIISIVYFLDSAINELFPKSYNTTHSLIVFLLACSIIFYLLDSACEETTFSVGFSKVMTIGLEYILSMIVVGAMREFLCSGELLGIAIIPEYGILPFFKSFAGGLFVVIILVLIYNIAFNAIKKRNKIFSSLKARYSEVIKSSGIRVEEELNNIKEVE